MSREHGTRARYVMDECRCASCTRANTVEQARWRRRKLLEQYGVVEPQFVDAEPVRRHVRRLMDAGVGLKQIAARAGASHGAVCRLVYGAPALNRPPSARITAANARKLLAVGPADAADGALVDATGTRRRLQALMAVGWSGSELMRRLGDQPTRFGVLLGQSVVTVRTARKVRALYEQLWNRPPAATTRWQRISVIRARNHATSMGWPPPLAWDDDTIDDPAAQPATAATNVSEIEDIVDDVAIERAIKSGDPSGLTRAERTQLAVTLFQRGTGATAIARVLRCSGSTVNHLLRAANAS